MTKNIMTSGQMVELNNQLGELINNFALQEAVDPIEIRLFILQLLAIPDDVREKLVAAGYNLPVCS